MGLTNYDVGYNKFKKNKFKKARYWHDFKASPNKIADSHVFSLTRVVFYDYLG